MLYWPALGRIASSWPLSPALAENPSGPVMEICQGPAVIEVLLLSSAL